MKQPSQVGGWFQTLPTNRVKETIANNEKNYGNRENWAVGGKNGNQQFETTKQ